MNDFLMKTYNKKPASFVKGEGIYLWDDKGRKYIDALCGLAVTSLGHSNPEISNIIKTQSETLIHSSNAFNIKPQEELAEKLCLLSGMDKAFFCNSGAEAVETSIKIAKKYGNDKNIKNPKIIVMEGSFHGRTMAALSATDGEKVQKGFAPLLDGFIRAPYNNVECIEKLVLEHNDIVAILLEPIQGEGGIIIPDKGYLKNLKRICDSNQLFLMIDEVQSGFCRTGKWFAFQHDEITPDVIMVAKALGNGVPIGACLAKNTAADTLTPGTHGSTFGGNFLSTTVGLKVVDIMQTLSINDNAKEMGNYFQKELKEKIANKKTVKEIRNKGLMIGIELVNECINLAEVALKSGLIINITQDNIIRMLPPLIINRTQIDDIISILNKIID
jgi:acetylornithine aminotransferase